MNENHLWNRAKKVNIQTSADIVGNFDIGFDSKIPEDTKDALMQFVYWVEDNFYLPVTLWVDFKYEHYLIDRNKKRVGYRFYWADFATYPVFDNPDDIPVIELPVRTERQTEAEILTSFIEGISHYFAWLSGADMREYTPEEAEVNGILEAYLDNCNSGK